MRHVRRGNVEVRHHLRRLRARLNAVHLNHLHAALRDVRIHPVANGAHVRSIERRACQRTRHALGIVGHAHLAIAVVVAGDQIRGGQDILDGRVEPSIDAVSDQLAADQQDEHGRNQRHAEQDRHQFSAEARERQRSAPLDDQLDHVPREHERQTQQDREVGCPEAVEDELGEEIGRQARGTVGERDDAAQRGKQQDHPGEDEPRVVAQRPARGRSRRAPHSFAFNRSLSSLMNSPISRKCRYTDAKRT